RAQQYRVNVETDFVNQSGFKQRLCQQTAAHYADVLPILFFETPDEIHYVFRNDGQSLFATLLERATENVRVQTLVQRQWAVTGSDFVSTSPHQHRVDRFPVVAHDLARFFAP